MQLSLNNRRLLELKTLLNNEEKDTLQQKAFYKQLIPLRGPELVFIIDFFNI